MIAEDRKGDRIAEGNSTGKEICRHVGKKREERAEMVEEWEISRMWRCQEIQANHPYDYWEVGQLHTQRDSLQHWWFLDVYG